MVQVLVVDDEAQIRVVLRAYLEREGYTVAEAATGKEALALAGTSRPDLVLLDICLLYTSPSPRDRTRSRMPSSA